MTKLVVFGLSVSSAWGNGHATLWRSLITALDRAGHEVVFFERDVSYYAAHRDLTELPGRSRLVLYGSWDEVRPQARDAADSADAAIVTSYCADGKPAAALVAESRARVRAFYDLDTPITLRKLEAGEQVAYLPDGGLGAFDLVLSFTGGRALDLLRTRLGARKVAALYGSVDPAAHRPTHPEPAWRSACSYLGTWSADRQRALDELFLEPARRRARRFLLGGAQYPVDIAWPPNVDRIDHVPPASHPAFYCSSPITVNVTRAPMAALGYCPSGRLFEAAACGVPVLTDWWQGLDEFFAPGQEIFVATTADAALDVIELPRGELARVGRLARERALTEHTATRRAAQLLDILGGTA